MKDIKCELWSTVDRDLEITIIEYIYANKRDMDMKQAPG